MKNYLYILLVFLPISGCSQNIDNIDSSIESTLLSQNIPSLAVAIIDSGNIVHLSTHGLSDIHLKKTATINTPYHIASVSKIVINLAIFKLVETGKINLDEDINQYLAFEIKSPHFPDDIITIHELLNHRSGILDDYELYEPYWSIPKGDSNIELGVFLKDYLHVEGKSFNTDHFNDKSNPHGFSYSNTGYALLGLIIENVSGISLEEFCQEMIFKPLKMNHTSWFLRNLDSTEVAKTYVYYDSTGHQFKGHNGYPDYPAGQLRTSIHDFAQLIAGYLTPGGKGFILNARSINQITPSPQIAQEGFYTWYMTSVNNHLYYSHQGGDLGVRTMVMMDVNNHNGIIVFANGETDLIDFISKIEKEAFGD